MGSHNVYPRRVLLGVRVLVWAAAASRIARAFSRAVSCATRVQRALVYIFAPRLLIINETPLSPDQWLCVCVCVSCVQNTKSAVQVRGRPDEGDERQAKVPGDNVETASTMTVRALSFSSLLLRYDWVQCFALLSST